MSDAAFRANGHCVKLTRGTHAVPNTDLSSLRFTTRLGTSDLSLPLGRLMAHSASTRLGRGEFLPSCGSSLYLADGLKDVSFANSGGHHIRQGTPSVIQVIFIMMIPESPRWLIGKGRFDEARKVLTKYQ